MDKEKSNSLGEKFNTWTVLIKNIKFIALTIVSLVFFGAIIISGDMNKIFLGLYEDVTGQKPQTYSPIQDYSSATYIILKDKLSREFNHKANNAEISIFEVSKDWHKFRVEINNEVYVYDVNKNQNNIWQIKKVK